MYERLIQIEFNHCDPAGIVFYPRYFEMVNSVIENFFADVVGRSFASMHFGADNGVPTVAMEAVFQKPSRLGDKVRFSLRVEKVGGSSVRMVVQGAGPDGPRMQAVMTLAWIDGMKAAPWPAKMRAALEAYRETQDA
ncbi:MAG: hotdog domain-containing protein [Tabrizicola sp.]|uniref:acyl-CoA thioesterase n=1 Tax=Tabrizicola sp. TaxID=2005166 RepID=UPI002ABC772E|nr:thioesterase family protein [Tabrizicola sp.]MDZ4086289.1 hotdog domain-containing protein [Tabrizicola sp.]